MPFLKSKKSIDKISSGDLRMAKAELTFSVSTIQKKISDIDKKIDAELASCKKVFSEYEAVSISKKISNLLSEKKELIQRLQLTEKKKSAVARLIMLKDEKSIISSKKSDIFRHLDIEELVSIREEKEIRAEIEEMRIDKILDKSGDSSDSFNRVLGIIKSVSLDDESVNIAKTELDELVIK